MVNWFHSVSKAYNKRNPFLLLFPGICICYLCFEILLCGTCSILQLPLPTGAAFRCSNCKANERNQTMTDKSRKKNIICQHLAQRTGRTSSIREAADRHTFMDFHLLLMMPN